jgi:glutamine amidotransferase
VSEKSVGLLSSFKLVSIMTVDIVSVGSGNIASIKHWIETTHSAVRIVDNPGELRSDLVILPGVGSAGPFMQRLRETGFDQAIMKHALNGGRLLGICLGFQVMADRSDESGGTECLGLIKGHVEKLNSSLSHNAWENFEIEKHGMAGQSFNSGANISRKRMLRGRVFYNHEYGFLNNDKMSYSLPISEELFKYSAIIVKDNIIGIQFHPEKSQITGHQLIAMIL